MTKFCIRCGAELILTSWDSYYCRNCGKLPENQDEKESDKKEVDYAG